LKVILGLGNPGAKYEATRHNVGWWVLDHLADVWRFDRWSRDGDSVTATGVVGTHKVRLVKPQTYMNLSGDALRPFLRRAFWMPAADLLVVVDDVALPVGRYRLRAQGSAGGHNGLKSVQHAIGNMNYPRLRIGVGPNEGGHEIGDLAEFVLGPFGRFERETIVDLMPRFADAAELWLRDGIERAMNAHNAS
jgi:PTH1 family peptidyl-tRNA hydrolase